MIMFLLYSKIFPFSMIIYGMSLIRELNTIEYLKGEIGLKKH